MISNTLYFNIQKPWRRLNQDIVSTPIQGFIGDFTESYTHIWTEHNLGMWDAKVALQFIIEFYL